METFLDKLIKNGGKNTYNIFKTKTEFKNNR